MECGNASENTIGELPLVVAAETTVGEKRKLMPAPKKGRVAKKIKQEDEDVCFVCLNGGDLVLCDFKGCPKAYHLSCIRKDKKILSSKVKWICGWHLCTTCLKSAHYMCYTCTISYCKKCTKDADFVRVRGNFGSCGPCLKSIMMIEVQDEGNEEKMEVDFDDEDSWDNLFKLYWIDVKNKLSLTLDELKEGQNTCKQIVGSDFLPRPSEDEATKTHEHSQLEIVHKASLRTESCGEKSMGVDGADWGSRELLEFISHIKNGDTTVMSRSNVQLLLLDYINSNNLHDPNHESQIICDGKLKKLFGKPFVGHKEMLMLLGLHFTKTGNIQKKVGIHVGADEHKSHTYNLRRASSKKDEDRTPQTNFDDYAAIDVHNISLIFLRRSMIESILGEVENFHEQVVGSIVRIGVSNDGHKPDMHRLVQVVGTSKGAESYQVGDKKTDVMLEVLNLTKKESIQIDTISDEDFSEVECKRLHRGIKFGLVKRLAVEEIQSKAVGLQALKFHDWLAAEILQLNHLRNQAKAKGLKKEVIECTKKLKMLKSPEERQRQLSSIPEVHSDPKMNPSYESEDEEEDKGDKPTGDERLHENENGCVSNTCDNKPEEDNAKGMSVSGNQASDSETAIKLDSPSIDIIENEEIWRYRDPEGRIQGPFSMTQLRYWSTTGFFPPDMKTWHGDNEDENSVLVSDAIVGNFHKVSTDRQKLSEISVGVSNVLDLPSPNPETGTENLEIVSDALVGNFHKVSTDQQKSSELSDDSNVLDLPSPSPETVNGNFEIVPAPEEIPVDMEIQASGSETAIILVSDAAVGKYHEVSIDQENSSELSVDNSNVLDLPSSKPETVTEKLEIVPAPEEIPVDMEIQASGSETATVLFSDASVGKYHEVSIDPLKSSELSVDDSNVLVLLSSKPETGTENSEIVLASEDISVDMEIEVSGSETAIILVSDASDGKYHEVSTDPQKSSELSVDDSNVLDLPSLNPKTDTENLETVPASEDIPVDMEIQASGSETAIILVSDAALGKYHEVSTDQQKLSELSVDDSNVPSPNPETATENLEIVPASEEISVDMEIQASGSETATILVSDASVGKYHEVSTDSQKSSELSVDDSNVLDLPSPNPETETQNLEIVPDSEEISVDMEIQVSGSETVSILVSDAAVGKYHEVSTDPPKSCELSVDDSHVLDVPSPNPETENLETVPVSEEISVVMEIQASGSETAFLLVSDASVGNNHEVSADQQKSSEPSVDDSNVLDLRPNPEIVTENLELVPAFEEISVDMEMIQASGSETAIIDASVGKYHEVSTDQQKSSELSVDDSNVLDLPSPNPETTTENSQIVPASEEIAVDMEILASGFETATILFSDASEENHVDPEALENYMNMLIGNDLPIFDALTDSNQNLSSWQAINECNEFTYFPEDDFLPIFDAPTDFNQNLSSWQAINEGSEFTNFPEDDFLPIFDAPTDSNQNLSSWQAINECSEFTNFPEESVEDDFLAEIDAMGGGGGGGGGGATTTTEDMIDFVETGRSDVLSSSSTETCPLLEALMDSFFENSDGAANNQNPPPTESSSSHVQ